MAWLSSPHTTKDYVILCGTTFCVPLHLKEVGFDLVWPATHDKGALLDGTGQPLSVTLQRATNPGGPQRSPVYSGCLHSLSPQSYLFASHHSLNNRSLRYSHISLHHITDWTMVRCTLFQDIQC